MFVQMPITSQEGCSPVLVMKLEEDGSVLHKAEQCQERMIDEHQTDLKISDVRSVKLEAESTVAQQETTGKLVLLNSV